MKKNISSLFLILSLSFTAHAMSVSELNSTISGSKIQYQGLRDFKPVLDGVLYRGGGPGGRVELQDKTQLKALCEQGFENSVYMYPDNFSHNRSVSCSNGQINYSVFGSSILNKKSIYIFLKNLQQTIVEKRGPTFVHCWNGWHASGEISAYALMQFCGWSGQAAGKYWQANVGDRKPYPSIVSRISRFQSYSDLNISQQDQSRICPQQ